MNTFKPQAELTVILRKTQAIEQCDADVAALKAGTSNIFRYDVSEPYFHQLRFHIESDPELAKKVSVSYVNEKEEILPITVTDSLRWPPSFLTECWDIEAKIHKVRREKVQAGAEPDATTEAASERPPKELARSGSAETGGEKADEVCPICGTLDYGCCPAVAIGDPWVCLKHPIRRGDFGEELADMVKAVANFRCPSQNQTVSSGVEGAHEGTTADKSAALNCPVHGRGYQKVCTCVALAESSLSSPPRCTLCGAPRIPHGQQGAGTCTLIGCKDPLHDNRAERFMCTCGHGLSVHEAERGVGTLKCSRCICGAGVGWTTNFRQSSSLTAHGAESVHSGKQNTADKSGTQLPKEK